jgi:LuxR family maltose regulon positive regulatory protein
VLALARQALGDIPRALDPLARALTLAEPEGYVRIFVEEGPAMAELLTRMQVEDESLKPDEGGGVKGEGGRKKDEGGRPDLSESEGMKEYVHKLLVAFGKQEQVHPSSPILHPLLEPLSERELEVLKMLGTEMNGPEIARELMVSLNTMRTHTKNIYSKLGVNNRRAAVRRAEELDLL